MEMMTMLKMPLPSKRSDLLELLSEYNAKYQRKRVFIFVDSRPYEMVVRDECGFLLFTLTAYSYCGEWAYSFNNVCKCDHTKRLHKLIIKKLSTFVDSEF